MNDDAQDPLAQARLAGRREGERFDAALRERERRERDELRGRPAEPAEEGDLLPRPDEATGEVWRLRQEVERLRVFHDAVLRSRPWRLLQAVRRPFGRSW